MKHISSKNKYTLIKTLFVAEQQVFFKEYIKSSFNIIETIEALIKIRQTVYWQALYRKLMSYFSISFYTKGTINNFIVWCFYKILF